MGSSRWLLGAAMGVIALGQAMPALAGEIEGTVIDESGTAGLRAVQVRIVELDRTANTGSDGDYRFVDVPAGTYTLRASYIGAATRQASVTVPASGPVDADFVLSGLNGDILVLGQRANLSSSLSRKRASDTISDVLSRDSIGQFPDQNVAESLRRLPGINVLNDQGEGRFVSVRGLDPELNATSLNGVRLPAPESDVRSVALDVISSDIIESIEVKKSLTPDMDADTIGASVEIETTSAFDRKKDLLTAKIEGSYNKKANELTPKGSVDFASRLSDNIGVSGGVSYYQRKFETDNIEADDWEDIDGVNYAEELQYRDYDVERERISATLGLDLRVGDTTKLYVKGLWSQFDDQEYRRRTTFDFSDAVDIAGSGSTVTFADTYDGDEDEGKLTVERDIKDRFERQRIRSVTFGGETELDSGFFAEYSASYAKSTEKENGSLDPTQFEHEFEGEGLIVDVDYADPRVPLYATSGNDFNFYEPSAYELKDIEYVALSDSQDEEWAAKLDFGKEMFLGNASLTLQAGAKGRWRKKTYDKTVEFYEWDGDGDYTLDDVLGFQTYDIIRISPVADFNGSRLFFTENFDSFEYQEIDSVFDSAIEDYRADEDVMAGYVMATWESGPLRAIGGVRYEDTKTDLLGNQVNLFEEGQDLPGGGTAEDDMVVIAPVAYQKDYGHWLPSLNLRYELQPDMLVRLAGYRSIVRPKLSKLAPRFEIDEDNEAVFGNPDLDPYEAWNLDASFEYYMSRTGAISAAVFYKDIKNYIVDTAVEDGSFLGVDFTEAEIPINGPSAEIFGAELSVSQSLSMLPAPLDGLLVQANYTYTDATGMVPNDGDIDDLRKITLPSTSKHTLNAVLGYEKGPLSLRLSGTYRDKYLDEISGEAEEDRYVDDHFQLDFSAKFQLTDMVQLYGEWVNINNAKYFAYNNYNGQRNLLQYEEYDYTVKFGARVVF
ncbi:TonB-dependent receptor [Croceicoccus naphthovorans]|uniref:TonB-dependent receptor n=1 Tax=Croceicoccus naphthovorans TaxID=1348774 RepID=A0A0G3XFS0_9SPHN|nr:TonB-dependent receptor [Croceicoccus naphthovorans]AKM09491.1 TonB-dependent receptor [Croceicoccus naphthovorans]MBB3991495.1 TonB-dependent receptor [Croceicoccus naphthovorans]